MTNGWPFDGWVIVVAMDNGVGCTGYNGMPRLVFKISPFYWSRKMYRLKTSKATTNMATHVSIHGILDAENQELMVVHRKIAETKLQSRTMLFIKDDTE